MATTTIDHHDDVRTATPTAREVTPTAREVTPKAREAAPKPRHHDEDSRLETLDQFALIRKPNDDLTALDVFYNAKEGSAKRKGMFRRFF